MEILPWFVGVLRADFRRKCSLVARQTQVILSCPARNFLASKDLIDAKKALVRWARLLT
jgi:surfactin synthase thioesterase subunit